jgi:hypothetical protein
MLSHSTQNNPNLLGLIKNEKKKEREETEIAN